MDDSEIVSREPCPECGSSKPHLARYSDGHAHCFRCQYHEHSEESGNLRPERTHVSASPMIDAGEICAIPARKLTEETCKKWGYSVADFGGNKVQVAAYKDDKGRIVAQKLRTKDKDFPFLGSAKEVWLFGKHLWRHGGKKLVITEGEIDAMSVSQVQGHKWPVVSVAKGSTSAAKCLAKEIEWVTKFEEIILMFDQDEPGRDAVEACMGVLPPGKCKVATLPLKDANEMLKADRGKEIIQAIWDAKVYRPDGIVDIEDIIEDAMKPIERGLPWCFDELTAATYGRRAGEVYLFGAGSGVGKTDVFTQQIAYDVNTLGEQVGVIYLEQPVRETAQRIAGKTAGQRFHIPDAGWTTDQLRGALTALRGKVKLYDHFGETDWNVVKTRIRYMAVAEGIKLIYLDHLTAMADPSKERESLEQTMKEMAGLAQELGIIIHCISHLSTPDGTPHEEGGRVMGKHFKGARAIMFWSHFMFGLERNTQAEDLDERATATFRCLKDRYTGQANGLTFYLKYDTKTGRLNQTESCPFKSETPPWETKDDGLGVF